MANRFAVGVLGITGYTGQVLASLLLNHPRATLVRATSGSSGGKPLGEALPAMRGLTDLVLDAPGVLDAVARECDVVFSCLPHGESGAAVAAVHDANPEAVAVDLSGDLRLRDASLARHWYGRAHAVAQEAVYGLSELFAPAIAAAKVVSNPGCYPTGALLPLVPVLRAQLASAKGVVVDSKSGVTGAGKSPTAFTHFAEVAESVKPYKVGEHKHAPEIEQGLALGTGQAAPRITFTPHLVPMLRGILTTAYLDAAPGATTESVLAALRAAYRGRPFVRVLPAGEFPDTKHVRDTNHVDLGAHVANGRVVLVSALDNLVKGAAGQAVQNMNLALGLDEATGLLPAHRGGRLAVVG